MPTVRNKFHDLGNRLNKISLAAMVTQEALKNVSVDEGNPEEIKQAIDKAIDSFQKIGQFVADADEVIGSFKPYVYKTFDPDAEIEVSTE